VRQIRSLAPDGAGHLAPGVPTALAGLDPDLVHAHNYHSFPLAISALSLAIRRASTPLVVTPHYHGTSDNDLRDRLLSLYAPLGRWALRRASAVIAVSEWERRQLREDFGIDPQVIPNGLDIDRFRTATPESREKPYLLTVGRLVEYKGVQHVVRALADSRLAEFDLVIAGSGPYRGRLEVIADEASVAGRVTFAGYVDDNRSPGLYVGASFFVSLSTVEAYGMTLPNRLRREPPVSSEIPARWPTGSAVMAVVASRSQPQTGSPMRWHRSVVSHHPRRDYRRGTRRSTRSNRCTSRYSLREHQGRSSSHPNLRDERHPEAAAYTATAGGGT